MAITRANAEAILINRLGTLMTEAGLDGTTVDGTNSDLNDAMGTALRQMGYSVTDIASVATADLAALTEGYYNEFLARCELRLLETVEGNLTLVDISTGPRSEKFSQLLEHVRARKTQLYEQITTLYGTSTIDTQYFSHDFAERDTE